MIDQLCIFKNIFLVVMVCLCVQSCANQLPPDGGPVDTTTPEIISIYPDSNARNFNDTKIRIEFDRYVEERTVEESIFISPYVGDMEFNWSGSDVEITFSEKLQSNTTYVVNIGTDVKDKFRNRMRMAKAYTLAFSTGPDIDRGGIEGTIFPRKEDVPVDGTMIFAYQLDRVNPDTLNPMKAKPNFITQTGKNGDFFLYHIPFGSYRIFAVRDEYRNLVYDQEADEYGVPSSIIHLSSEDTLAVGVLMKLAKEDTTGPWLVKATAPDRNHIIAEFSESVIPASVNLKSFTLIDTLDRKSLELFTVYPSATSSNSYMLVTEKQDSIKAYQLDVHHVTDSVGNKNNPQASSFIVQGSPKADTLGPRLVSVSIDDSVHNIELQPIFKFEFSDALARTTSLDFVNILDNNKQPVQVEKKWISDVMISVMPEKALMSRTWYILRADLHSIRDWAGRACHDSLKSWHFETLDVEDMSSIEGVVADVNKSDTAGSLYATAVQVGEKNPKRYTVVADASGRFVFPLVVEGRYTFQSFRDRNNNGMYDSGKPYPFVYSERLSLFSDTLKVRARWPLEGVHILLK
jgi:hypothetical protein